MRVLLTQRKVVAIGLAVLLVGICLAVFSLQRPNPANATIRAEAPPKDKATGLDFRLSEGAPDKPVKSSNLKVETSALSQSETEALLTRLPPLKAPAKQEFARPPESLPAPRPGKTFKQPFPPPAGDPVEQPAATRSAPQVLRYGPQGEIGPETQSLSVTFSEPMVAVSSHLEIAKGTLPVTLKPSPPGGTWRWIGTRTLLFEPKDRRFPMATNYEAEVPAQTSSALGGKIEKGVKWAFKTPVPAVTEIAPNDKAFDLDQLVFVGFDQQIDPASVLKTIQVISAQKRFALRAATDKEIADNESIKKIAAAHKKGAWLAFKALSRFQPDSPVQVTVGPGTPSAEGPLTTTKPQKFDFKTYSALKINLAESNYKNLTPEESWYIRFNNPINEKTFKQSMIQASPPIPGFKAEVYGNTVSCYGRTHGRTNYRVTVSATITDIFGQKLGRSQLLAVNVGSAPPRLYEADKHLVTLDPSAQPNYPIYSVNEKAIRVTAYKVSPSDWDTYLKFNSYDKFQPVFSKRRPASVRLIHPEVKPDELTITRLDLTPLLKNKLGQVVLLVETLDKEPTRFAVWVQATQIGLDAFVNHNSMLAWANALKDGQPLQGVKMQLYPAAQSSETDKNGLAKVQLPSESAHASMLVAQKGEDISILPKANSKYDAGSWWRHTLTDEYRWYIFSDRDLYRPDEEVHLKGWLRAIGAGPGGDVKGVSGLFKSLDYEVLDSRENKLCNGSLKLNALAGFDFTLKLPKNANLGQCRVVFTAKGENDLKADKEYYFKIQEFRRPEFEVTAAAEKEAPYFIGSHSIAGVTAKYYSGGTLPDAPVSWQVSATPAHYSPPNWSEFIFGKHRWWWLDSIYSQDETVNKSLKGTTDSAGQHHLRIDFDSVNPPEPTNVVAEATVTDVNRQEWTSRVSMLVHPSKLYVGLKNERMFVKQGEKLNFKAIVTDLDGKAVAGKTIALKYWREDWQRIEGEYKETKADLQERAVDSLSDPVSFSLDTKEGGQYHVQATVEDSSSHRNQTELTFWVAGGKAPPNQDLSQGKVLLIPDRKEYKSGDTAEILVQSPFTPAKGILTLRRSGLVKSESFAITDSTVALRVPIVDEYVPNLHVQVDLVGSDRSNVAGASAKTRRRPAYASGELNLSVPPNSRRLAVKIAPQSKELEPGGKTSIDIEINDAAGKPLSGSEVAIAVVDESVLALTDYKLVDPVTEFYSDRDGGIENFHSRDYVVLSTEQVAGTAKDELAPACPPPPAPMRTGAGGGGPGAPMLQGATYGSIGPQSDGATVVQGINTAGVVRKRAFEASASPAPAPAPAQAAQPAIQMRSNFSALALFSPSVTTDSSGKAQVALKLPDSLTRYRIMAVAVADGRQFGSGESTVTARIPLMVRPSAPRFLNFGDRCELPTVLQNQTDETMEVKVAMRAGNLTLQSEAGQSVKVPAHDRVEVRFPVKAEDVGQAICQFAAASGQWSDASEVSFPVWTPSTTEAFATYGEIDDGSIMQPVQAPSEVYSQFGGLEIAMSSTALQGLTDAVLYLTKYPFECSEQLSSRVLAIASLRDVLSEFHANGLPDATTLERTVQQDISVLESRQNYDGSFGLWSKGESKWPYVTIHVAHALQMANDKGFAVPPAMLSRVKDYLSTIENHIPASYSASCRNSLIAFSLNIRHKLKDSDPGRARKLIKDVTLEKLSLESIGWLLPVLSKNSSSSEQVAAIRTYLNNRVKETASTAQFSDSYGDSDYLMFYSGRRVDAVILEALIEDQPKNDLIPKLVKGLLAHKKEGRWENTQENSAVLIALDRYFNTYEKVKPEFVARVWLGSQFAGQQDFVGRSTNRNEIDLPMSYLAERSGSQNLILSKDGPGRLYYRIGMRYAPKQLILAAADHGFTVERDYEGVDDPKDVRKSEDGVWHIKSGATVRVRLNLVAPARRYHVALVDPLPGGLEGLNPDLATTKKSADERPNQPEGFWWWWRPVWYEHQNMRDDRVEAFSSLLWDGVHKYSYQARATTPGTYIVPPPKAEEMYAPETFGRGPSDTVVVE
jgi:uncharacterized protein YfaS (alpha-2-macroglobulin family)